MSAANPWAIAIFDIDGVIRDVGQSYRRAIADTVEHFTAGAWRPTLADIDTLKAEGIWNNDWKASEELIRRQGVEPPAYEVVVDFFQRRYRGQELDDPSRWDGYITVEPLLVGADYFADLSAAGVGWGFFSGATPGSARFVLEQRLGLLDPVLVAMGDAPDKPDPTGFFQAIAALEPTANPLPAVYAGDTVADIHTALRAREAQPQRPVLAVGVLPPHVLGEAERRQAYEQRLHEAGADLVVEALRDLTAERLRSLL